MRILTLVAASLVSCAMIACGSDDGGGSGPAGTDGDGGDGGSTAQAGSNAKGGAAGKTAKGGSSGKGGGGAGEGGTDGGEGGTDGADAGSGGTGGGNAGTGGKGGSSSGTGGKGGSSAGTGGKGGSSAGTGGKGGSSAGSGGSAGTGGKGGSSGKGGSTGTGGKGGSTAGTGGASGNGGSGDAGAGGGGNDGYPFIIVAKISGADEDEEKMIAEGIALANTTMKTDCFRDFVLNAKWTETKGLSQAQIWDKLSSGPVTINLEMYTGSKLDNYVYKTIGYEDEPGEVHMNRFFVDTAYEVASNAIHEAEGHTQGFSHYQVKATSVPYGLNDAFESCADAP